MDAEVYVIAWLGQARFTTSLERCSGAEVSKVMASRKRWAETEVPTSCTWLEQVKVTTSLKRWLDTEVHVTKNTWLKQVGEVSKKEEAGVLVGAEVPVTFTISLKR